MKIPYLIALFLLIGAQSAFCQSSKPKLLPGFIIPLSGDTIEGFLVNQTDWQMGSSVLFGENESETSVKPYQAGEIAGFGYNQGRNFKSLRAENDSMWAFGKMLLLGKVNLFVLGMREGKDVYYVERTDSLLTLKLVPPQDSEFYRYDRRFVKRDTRYVDALNRIMDRGNDSISVEELSYGHGSIVKFVKSYNRESGDLSVVYKEKITTTYHVSVGLGTPIYSPSDPNEPLTQRGLINTQIRYGLSVSGYVLRRKAERTNRRSYLFGASYQYILVGSRVVHVVKVLPVGIHLEADTKGRLAPYFWCAAGTRLASRDVSSLWLIPFMAIESCVGLKIKLKSSAIYTELTGSFFPGIVYLNMGYAF